MFIVVFEQVLCLPHTTFWRNINLCLSKILKLWIRPPHTPKSFPGCLSKILIEIKSILLQHNPKCFEIQYSFLKI